MRRAWPGVPVSELEEAPGHSPGRADGHRALPDRFCAPREPGPPLPGRTARTLEGREQMPAGMSTSAGPGEVSLRDCPPGACSVPEGLRGRAGGRGEEGALQALSPPATVLGPTLTAPTAPLLHCRRETLLSPCSIESGASSSFLSDMDMSTVSVGSVPVPAAPGCLSQMLLG